MFINYHIQSKQKKTQGTSRYNFIANNISQNAKLYSERTVLSIPPYEERG